MRKIRIAREGPPWRGEMEGAGLGSGVSLILTRLAGNEKGPALHRHPYDETFFVCSGDVAFSDGTATLEAKGGDLVVVPAGMPHRFDGLLDGVEMIDIHVSGRFSTEWL